VSHRPVDDDDRAVGHDTQLCLWDVTEDVLKQASLPPVRVRISSSHTPAASATPVADLPVVKKRSFLLGECSTLATTTRMCRTEKASAGDADRGRDGRSDHLVEQLARATA